MTETSMTQRPVKIGMMLYLPQYNSYYATDVFIVGNCLIFNNLQTRMTMKPDHIDFRVEDIGKGWSRDGYLVMPALWVDHMTEIAAEIVNNTVLA